MSSKGKTWKLGYKRIMSEETKKKISLSHIGKKHSEETKRLLSILRTGKTSWSKGLKGNDFIKHYKNGHPKGMLGKKPWNFIDGNSGDRRFMLRVWINIAKECYKRDNYTCQICNKYGGKLHAHHIIPWSISKDDRLENLITLCPTCHTNIHKRERDKYGRFK